MAFGPDGTVYYANIVFSRVSPASGVAVSTSHDGGRTWTAPNMVSFINSANFFNDKEWIAAGPNGKVVVTWTKFNQGPHGVGYIASPIVGAISNDSGKTWNRQGFPISDPSRPYDQGSQVAFGRNGDLYVAYEASDPATGYATDVMSLARSTDDGRNFSTVDLARVYDDFDCYPIFDGRQTLTNQHFRLNSYPSMAIDPSTGRVSIAWTDDQGAGNCGTGGDLVQRHDIEPGEARLRRLGQLRIAAAHHPGRRGQGLPVRRCRRRQERRVLLHGRLRNPNPGLPREDP